MNIIFFIMQLIQNRFIVYNVTSVLDCVNMMLGHSDLSVRAEESSSSTAKPANMESMLTSNNVHVKNSSGDVGARDWESGEGASILLDLHTPLRSFPPFRFG